MQKCIGICIILCIFTIGLASAQADSKAATKNTWYFTSMFSAHYRLPIEEADYTEEGALSLDINPRVLWFPTDGLGIGIDTDLYYYTGQFNHLNLSIGPSAAYYLKRPGILTQLMPYAGCSFQYLMNDVNPGASETGWGLKFGLGISPIIGENVALPVELGYVTHHITLDYGDESSSKTTDWIYLEFGIGVFLW